MHWNNIRNYARSHFWSKNSGYGVYVCSQVLVPEAAAEAEVGDGVSQLALGYPISSGLKKSQEIVVRT